MRDRRLQGVQAVIERKQCVTPEGDDDRLLLGRQNCRARFLRPRRQIGHRGPLLPLRHRLLVDAVALRQGPQALLTMLYRLTPVCAGKQSPGLFSDPLDLSSWRSQGEPGP